MRKLLDICLGVFIFLMIMKIISPALSSSFFAHVVKTLPEAVITVDPQRMITSWNSAAETMYGWTAEEMVGQSIKHLWEANGVGFYSPEVRKAFETTGHWQGEVRQRRKDGTTFPVSLQLTVICDEEGQVSGWAGVARDISQRKRGEEAYRESQWLLETAEEVAKFGSWKWDLQTQRATWSAQMFALLEVDPAGFDGRMEQVWADRIHPEDLPRVQAVNRAALEGIAPEPLAFRILLPDGSERVLWTHSELIRDEDGNPIYLVGYVQDLTEQKRAEAQLQASEARYRRLVENMNDMVLEIDEQGMLCYASPSYAALSGFALEDEVGTFALKHIHPEDLPLVLEKIQKAFITGHEDLTYRVQNKAGAWRWLETSGRIYQAEGGKPRLIAVIRDVTERKETQEALIASEQNLKTLLETVSEGIALNEIVYDKNGEMVDYRIVKVNKAFYATADFHGEEVVGNVATKLYGMSSDFIKNFWKMHLKKDSTAFTEMVSPLNQRTFFVATSPFVNDQFVTTFFDITERKQVEEALLESEERFRMVFEASTSAMILTDKDGKIRLVNDRTQELLGYEKQEILGEPIETLVPSRFQPAHRPQRQELFAHRQSPLIAREFEFFALHQNGHEIPVEIGLTPFQTREGRFILATLTDLTERKQAENALRRSEAQMRALVTSLDDIVFEFDEKGTYLNVWTGNEGLLTQPKDTLTGRRITEILGESGIQFEEAVRRVFQRGSPESIEYPLTVQSGTRWFVAHLNPILSPEGVPQMVSMLVRDITERKQAEIALRESEALFSKIFHSSPVGINIFRLSDGQSFMVNDGFLELIGYSHQEVLGHTAEELNLFVDKEARDNWMRSLRAGGEVRNQDALIRRKSGEIRNALASLDVIDLDGKPMILVISTDITERKQAETQLQRQLQRLGAMNEIDRAISSSLDIHLSLDILLSEVLDQLEVDAASIMLFNNMNHALEYAMGKGFHTQDILKSQVGLGEGMVGRAALERKVLIVPSLQNTEITLKRTNMLRDEQFVSYLGVPLIAKGMLKGVLEIFQRSPLTPNDDWLYYLNAIAEQAAIAIDNAQLFDGVQRSNLELMTAYDATIEGWSHAMDLRDRETEGHSQRVTHLTMQLAKRMGLPAEEMIHLRRGALLHDIGKLGVPDGILLKPGKLTDEEWAIMRQHPNYAFEMLAPIAYLRPAVDIPYCHHEKWDGTGYPRGLKGTQIPRAARIFAIIDVWDALRSDRPYRASWSVEKTRAYIIEQSGKHFEPQVVEAFLKVLEEGENI